MNEQQVLDYVIQYLNENFGDVTGEIKPDTSLLENRLLDSISTLQMVNDLEEYFRIEAEAHEITSENLNTPERIAQYILRKLH